jgi:anionic cell wall polymer biosynthesis LytR-Cps2A-Psr (LCP) family protein
MKQKKQAVVKKDASWLLLLAILAVAAAGVAAGYFLVNGASFSDSFSGDRMASMLFIIEDSRENSRVKAQTNNTPASYTGLPIGAYALFCYPSTRRAALFDIPQDIGLIIKSLNRVDRIDRIYDPARPEIYRREIEGLLGISIPQMVVLTMDGLAALVDLVEGIELNIPEKIVDRTVQPPVLIPAGRITLDGDKATAFFRFESPDDDNAQVRVRRESFFLALIKKIGEKQAMLSNIQVKRHFNAAFRGMVDPITLDRFFTTLAAIDAERVTSQGIGGNYRDVSGEQFLIPHYDGSLIKDIVSETVSGLLRPADSLSGGRLFSVEVLNGTTTAGLAGRTAELLKSFGYDVIRVGNVEGSQHNQTLVIDRTGVGEYGEAFASIIRCKNIQLEAPDAELEEGGVGMRAEDVGYRADFTLVLGWDFNGRYTSQ